jgi:hypothetical protein
MATSDDYDLALAQKIAGHEDSEPFDQQYRETSLSESRAPQSCTLGISGRHISLSHNTTHGSVARNRRVRKRREVTSSASEATP